MSDNIDEGKTDFFHEVTDFTEKHPWILRVGSIVLGGLSWIATNRLRKGKGRTAKKFFRLAKAAEDLAEVARIQESIDDLLADGAMDGPVHQNVSKLLSERKKILLNRMNKISDPNLSK